MAALDPDSAAPPRGPSLAAIVQMAPDLLGSDPATIAERLRADYGHVVRIPPIHPALDAPVYLVSHPDDLQFVLQSDPEKFGPLDVPGTRDFGMVVEDSILSLSPGSDDGSWLKRTRMVSPEFHERAAAGNVPALAETTLATLGEFTAGSVHDGDPATVPEPARVSPLDGDGVRLLPGMRRLTLRLLGASLFGADLRAHEVEVIDAVAQLRSLFKHRQLDLVRSRVTRHVPEELHLPGWLQDSLGRDLTIRLGSDSDEEAAVAIQRLAAVADAIASRRTSTPQAFGDALSTWLLRPDPVDGDVLSPETLRHEVVGLLIAGHATTSAALTWAFYLLASRPGAQARIRREARETSLLADAETLRRRAEDGDAPAAPGEVDGTAVLDELPYTRRVWQETLRLYPPLPMFGRTATDPVVLGGVDLDAGAHVLLSPYVTHRDPAFWTAPERFDPERFAPERAAERHEFAHVPFSAGPHACLGRALATTQALVVLATTLSTHRVAFAGTDDRVGPHADPGAYGPDVGPDTAINLQPDRDVVVRFEPLD